MRMGILDTQFEHSHKQISSLDNLQDATPNDKSSEQVGSDQNQDNVSEKPQSDHHERYLGNYHELASHYDDRRVVPVSDLFLMAFYVLPATKRLYLSDFSSANKVIEAKRSYRGAARSWPPRSCWCYGAVAPGYIAAELRRSKQNPKHVALGQVTLCGDVHKCPPCGLQIILRYQIDTSAVVDALREDGYRLVLLVLTAQHKKTDSLAHTSEIVKAGYEAAFIARNRDQKERLRDLGIVGRQVAPDILYGANGWHPHNNVLLVIAPGHEQQLEEIREKLWPVYAKAIQSAGGFTSQEHGMNLTEYKHGKSYSLKHGFESLQITPTSKGFGIGFEQVSTGNKTEHGLPINALRLAAMHGYNGPEFKLSVSKARELCLEYANTMQGRRMIVNVGVFRDYWRKLATSEGKTEEQLSEVLPDNYDVPWVFSPEDFSVAEKAGLRRLFEAAQDGRHEEYLHSIGLKFDPVLALENDAHKAEAKACRKRERDEEGDRIRLALGFRSSAILMAQARKKKRGLKYLFAGVSIAAAQNGNQTEEE